MNWEDYDRIHRTVLKIQSELERMTDEILDLLSEIEGEVSRKLWEEIGCRTKDQRVCTSYAVCPYKLKEKECK